MSLSRQAQRPSCSRPPIGHVGDRHVRASLRQRLRGRGTDASPTVVGGNNGFVLMSSVHHREPHDGREVGIAWRRCIDAAGEATNEAERGQRLVEISKCRGNVGSVPDRLYQLNARVLAVEVRHQCGEIISGFGSHVPLCTGIDADRVLSVGVSAAKIHISRPPLLSTPVR